MSVNTEADEALYVAKKSVNEAIDALSKIVVTQCSGHDEFRPPYRAKMKSRLFELISIREDLES